MAKIVLILLYLIHGYIAIDKFFETEEDGIGNMTRAGRSINASHGKGNNAALVCPSVLFGRPSSCKSLSQCSPWYLDILRGPSISCPGDGAFSMCCPSIFSNRAVSARTQKPSAFSEDGRVLLAKMSEHGKKIVASSARLSRSQASKGKKTKQQTDFAKSTDLALSVVDAARALKAKNGLNPVQAGIGLQRFDVRETVLRNACPAQPFCSFSSKYRTMDGSCNNRLQPNWGKAGTPVERILPPSYADGIWTPKRAKSGAELPNVRAIRSRVLFDEDHPWNDATHMSMQWGQFLDHDLSHVPMFRSANDSVIQCCSSKNELLSPKKKHRHCFEVEIPANDKFFKSMGVRCLNMIRSVIAPRADCRFGYADQMNIISHFIDASHIYGNDDETAHKLRELKRGRMSVQKVNGKDFPPEDPSATNCIRDPGSKGCFISGDDRMNQVPGLTALHILFLREHNRLAGQLEKLNPHWSDEKIFQETRRIMGALMQRITYNEYLPVVLGNRVIEAYSLYPLSGGYSNTYNEFINPSITNEFTTAAFRMGHSLIQGDWHSVSESGQWTEHKLRDWFNRPGFLKTPNQLDSVTRGLVEQRCQSADEWVSEEVSNHLFQRPGKKHGFDLISINIRRGRDHGLDGYNAYRQVCGLRKARRFEDLTDVMNSDVVARLKSMYSSVEDIDLYVGGLSERQVPGGMVGPTFTCLIADQFARLKEGDRFFYEHGGQHGSFTPGQLEEIRKYTLARLICDNSDDIKILQPMVFRVPGKFNPRLTCSSNGIPKMDLRPWKE
ncbi:peroxidase-like isoform X1 [Artemia franciscana]